MVLPLVDEIAAARASHSLLLMTGGGTRSRHGHAIGSYLGMTTDVLAKLGSNIGDQNALMLSVSLWGHQDRLRRPGQVALLLLGAQRYSRHARHASLRLLEEPAAKGRLPPPPPPHRTDSGGFLTAESVGAKRCILVKDKRGLFTADPKKHPAADFISEIELLGTDLVDLAVERAMLRGLAQARSVREVLIINGRVAGNLT